MTFDISLKTCVLRRRRPRAVLGGKRAPLLNRCVCVQTCCGESAPFPPELHPELPILSGSPRGRLLPRQELRPRALNPGQRLSLTPGVGQAEPLVWSVELRGGADRPGGCVALCPGPQEGLQREDPATPVPPPPPHSLGGSHRQPGQGRSAWSGLRSPPPPTDGLGWAVSPADS